MRVFLLLSALLLAPLGLSAAVAQDDATADPASAQQPTIQQSATAARPRPDSAGSVFEVPRVPVRAEADSAAAAQQIARDQGRARAMDILLRRLTAEADWDYLPQLVAGEAAPVAGDAGMQDGVTTDQSAPGEGAGDLYDPYSPEASFTGGRKPVRLSAAELPAMEEGFAVFNEKSSARTYSANITYRFKAEAVRDLLKQAKIPFSESQTRMALVIPVLETPNGTYLWETNNPWARAWLARPLANELTPMVLPRGDETDMDLISVDEVVDYDQAALSQMANRYGVAQVLVAHAQLNEEDEQFRLRGRLIDAWLGDSANAVSADFDTENAGALYDDTAGFGSEGVLVRTAGAQAGRTLFENFFRAPTGDFPALAQRAVENTVSKYAAGWKAQTLIDHSVSRQLTVNVWLDSFDDMGRINGGLRASPVVDSVTTNAMAAGGGKMTITVVGDMETLIADLRQRDLVFWTADGRTWNIATPAVAERKQRDLPPIEDAGAAFDNGTLRGMGSDLPGSVSGPVPGEGFSPPLEREQQRRSLRDDEDAPAQRNPFAPQAEESNEGEPGDGLY